MMIKTSYVRKNQRDTLRYYPIECNTHGKWDRNRIWTASLSSCILTCKSGGWWWWVWDENLSSSHRGEWAPLCIRICWREGVIPHTSQSLMNWCEDGSLNPLTLSGHHHPGNWIWWWQDTRIGLMTWEEMSTQDYRRTQRNGEELWQSRYTEKILIYEKNSRSIANTSSRSIYCSYWSWIRPITSGGGAFSDWWD